MENFIQFAPYWLGQIPMSAINTKNVEEVVFNVKVL